SALPLRERLALPYAPVSAEPGGTTAPGGVRERRALSELEQACWNTRLGVLGIGPDQAAALVGESAERLGGRAAVPDWALFIEKALAVAPDAPGPRPCFRSSVVRPEGGPRGVRCVRSQGGGSSLSMARPYSGDSDN
ncbi:hypothetical protein, partial [Streptomyces sp. SID4917]|uniref:hypothetical protein n=1 Tax=Streptomyces sp. SID4917 TaxID=2690269 RepID=UPI00136C5A25